MQPTPNGEEGERDDLLGKIQTRQETDVVVPYPSPRRKLGKERLVLLIHLLDPAVLISRSPLGVAVG